MRKNVLFRQLMNLLDDSEVWLTLLFIGLAAFFSYSSWVAPAYRDEMILACIGGAIASATGVRKVLLAFAASHAVSVVALTNQGINTIEKVAGVNLVPDDLQTLGMKAFLKVLEDLKKDAVTSESLAELQAIENKVKDLWPKG